MGLLGVPIPEEFGGFGGGGVDTMIVMEAFGRALVVEPYLSTVVLAGSAISLGGSDAQRKILLPRIVDGSMKFAFAHTEPGTRFELNRVETTARQAGGMWVINGRKSVVLHGAVADLLIVTARTSGAPDSPHGITLFFVNPGEQGVAGREYPTYDGMRAAEVTLRQRHHQSRVGDRRAGQRLPVARGGDRPRHRRGLCARPSAAWVRCNAATLEYLKTRQQFGVPIGRFQALQHRMVDMLMQYEQAKSMALLAAVKVDSADAAERRRCLSAAKELIGRAGRFVEPAGDSDCTGAWA